MSSRTPVLNICIDTETGLVPELAQSGQRSPVSEDAFSLVEEAGIASSVEESGVLKDERLEIIQDLYEGKRTCQCCRSWVDEPPEDMNNDKAGDGNADAFPLIVRHQRSTGGTKSMEIHSIEIRHPKLRAVLVDVFKGFDSLVPGLKYLTFLAPFRQFYFQWDKFEAAIKEQTDEFVIKALKWLHRLVKAELADTFSVSKELLKHGIITDKYLWTLYKPGDLIYTKEDGYDRFYVLRSAAGYYLTCTYVDWNGTRFGLAEKGIQILPIKGTQKITELEAFPAKYLKSFDALKERLTLRGKKFEELAGVHYKSYREYDGSGDDKPNSSRRYIDRRIMVDTALHPDNACLRKLEQMSTLGLFTGLIRQEPPISIPPPSGHHIPLPPPGVDIAMWNHVNPGPPMGAPPGPPPMPVPYMPHHKKAKKHYNAPMPPEFDPNDVSQQTLTEFHLPLCNPEIRGFCLREKEWTTFNVENIHDIEWNNKPFDNLVLPEGYKELILAFVESQIHHGDAFDDVINGKGGGLVILLAGSPGVGKTLTAESVAERIKAPLYKMAPRDTEDENSDNEHAVVDDFKLAAKWNAVLLIDECDTYLHKRTDHDPRRNKIVSTFLHKLEYHPSLLFLTTNRSKALDTALSSRVHLTINYPALDTPSRLTIWQNFLTRAQTPSKLLDWEIEKLALIDINGRRIRNVVKTAQIMAKREGRSVELDDIKTVLRITEGLTVDEVFEPSYV